MTNACIVAYFMPNINEKTVELQKRVVDKLNVSKYPFFQFKGEMRHPTFIDYFWALNGLAPDYMKDAGIKQEFDFDVVLFLDIDCIPLSEKAIDFYIERASKDILIGNAQRSNHLQNDKHVFAAPSACCLNRSVYEKMQRPSAVETNRSDVSEEWTWAAEKFGVDVEITMPTKFDKAPHKYDWEDNKDPYWELGEGMPVYGIGTTFGTKELGDLYWHSFQIFQPGHQERMWEKCEAILAQ
jgi:hypothetical protein